MGEKGDKADKKKPGIENLAKALDLGNKDGSGWEVLDGYASDPTATALPDRKDTICAPADPVFDEKAFQALVTSSGTSDWGYPTQPGLEVRGGPQPNAPVIEKLGMHFVRVMADDAAPQNQQNPTMRIVTPSGKVGFVPAESISPLGNDQICYAKEGGTWKITGLIGGDQFLEERWSVRPIGRTLFSLRFRTGQDVSALLHAARLEHRRLVGRGEKFDQRADRGDDRGRSR